MERTVKKGKKAAAARVQTADGTWGSVAGD